MTTPADNATSDGDRESIDWKCTCGSSTDYHTFDCLWPKTLAAVRTEGADDIPPDMEYMCRTAIARLDLAEKERDAAIARAEAAEKTLAELKGEYTDVVRHWQSAEARRAAAEAELAALRRSFDDRGEALDEEIAGRIAAEAQAGRMREALADIAQPTGMGVHRPAEVRLQEIARAALSPAPGGSSGEANARNPDGTPYHGWSDGIAKQEPTPERRTAGEGT